MKYFTYLCHLDQNSFYESYPNAQIFKFAYLKGYQLLPTKRGSVLTPVLNGFVEGLLYTIDDEILHEITKTYQNKHKMLEVVTDSGEVMKAIVFCSLEGEDHHTLLNKYYWKYGFDKSNLSLYINYQP
jgi:hypothetical protein